MLTIKLLLGSKKRPNQGKTDLAAWVPRAGVEPACPCGQWCLRPSRLPIPPSGLVYKAANI
jgi:hypothetical protein